MKSRFMKFFKNSGLQSLLLASIAITLILSFLGLMLSPDSAPSTIPWSDFRKVAEQGKVKSARIAGNSIVAILDDGKRIETEGPITSDLIKYFDTSNTQYSFDSSEKMTSFWYILFFALMGLAAVLFFFVRQNKGGGSNGIFSIGKSRARMVMPSQVKENFASVAGAYEAKQELQDVVDFLKNPDKYRRLGAHLPSGILLVGEPGNGKTLLAKAVAGEANCPFFSINGSDFIEVFVGVGAARIRDLFAQARKNSPCIVFIDEIDVIARQRAAGIGGGNDEREQTLNQLLTEMDGFSSKENPVIVLAATNFPSALDKALLRPGRFDRRIDIPYPDTDAREHILKIHARGVKLDEEVNLRAIAEDTGGFSGADLANLVNQAAIHATRSGRQAVMKEDIDVAYEKLMRSRETSQREPRAATDSASVARVYMPSQIKVTFKDVAGMPEVKEELYDVIDYLKVPDKYQRLGARLSRGILLVGEPGNGKTLLAKAMAGEANRPFFSASGSDFIEKYVGVGAARIRDLFAQARKQSPCIIFIDEIDAIGAARSRDGNSDREHSQTLNQLLTEMDGFESEKSSIVVIAATNRPDILDSALKRPGRFDREVTVPFPDLKSRYEILQVHAAKAKISPSVDMHTIARGTTGFSGADLANLINEALIGAVKANRDAAIIQDFEEARDKILMGKARSSDTRNKQELERTAYHEAGHALVALLKPEYTDPLHKLTILARGSALGLASYIPERDVYFQTKEHFIARIMVSLGGRVAEELIFGDVSTGPSSDLQSATRLAQNMIYRYGMDDRTGLISYDALGRHNISQETAGLLDSVMRDILNECYAKTKALLEQHRHLLEKITRVLLEKETLEGAEVYALAGIPLRKAPALYEKEEQNVVDTTSVEMNIAEDNGASEVKEEISTEDSLKKSE